MTSEQLAWKIRRHGIEMTHLSGGSHIGAILSVADIVAVLYSEVMHFNPQNPKWENRDRFILAGGNWGVAFSQIKPVKINLSLIGRSLQWLRRK